MVFLPRGLDVDLETDYVYVADTEADLIKKYTNNGGFIDSWGEFGTGEGQLKLPIRCGSRTLNTQRIRS